MSGFIVGRPYSPMHIALPSATLGVELSADRRSLSETLRRAKNRPFFRRFWAVRHPSAGFDLPRSDQARVISATPISR